jgi:hypothetical protein
VEVKKAEDENEQDMVPSFVETSEVLEPFYASAQNAAFETLAVKRFLCNLHSSVPNARPNHIGSSTRAFEQCVLVVGSYVVSTISSQNTAHGSVYKRHAQTAE